MEAKKDRKTGIIRHTYGTVYPKEFKTALAESGLVKNCVVNGVKTAPDHVKPLDEAVYDVAFGGTIINVISTGTRMIFVGLNERKMLDLFKELRGEEWEYDDTNKFDYLTK